MTYYLVVLRCMNGDTPLFLAESIWHAEDFIKEWDDSSMTGLNLDSWSTKYPSNLTIVTFIDGKPVGSTCIREFDVTEGWFEE